MQSLGNEGWELIYSDGFDTIQENSNFIGNAWMEAKVMSRCMTILLIWLLFLQFRSCISMELWVFLGLRRATELFISWGACAFSELLKQKCQTKSLYLLWTMCQCKYPQTLKILFRELAYATLLTGGWIWRN